jgi:hypothetical protein
VDNIEVPRVQDGAPHIPGLFQTIFDVNHPQNATVHLELPITDDYETELEEFCRLQRLGNFASAEEYFKDNLEPLLGNPYVFVQYGQMLLEKGDYLAFESLNAEAVFGKEGLRMPRPRLRIIAEDRDRYQPRARSGSWSRTRAKRRQVIVRSRSPSPVESNRPQRHTRVETDVRIVRRSRSRSSSRSRSRSRYIERYRDYDDGDRDYRRDHSHSPDGGAQLQAMRGETRRETQADELELLFQNWKLMKAICNIHSEGNYQDAFAEAWYTIHRFDFGTGIGSTEASIYFVSELSH